MIKSNNPRSLISDLDHLQTSYRPFLDAENENSDDELPPNFQSGDGVNERIHHDETPGSGVMIHMVPEGSKSRWSHIDDLDSFFKKVYDYRLKHGFSVMIVQESLELLQFVFIVFLTSYLYECVDYNVLFRNKKADGQTDWHEKTTLTDAMSSVGQCLSRASFLTWFWLLIAFSFWIIRVVSFFYHVFQFWDIKSFYNSALGISDEDLDSVTWSDIQRKLVEAQTEHLMCIHKEQLTELDIYHRILRFKNYMVAMVNKDLLPCKLNLPFIGEVAYLSQSLKFNIEYLLFKSPWAPFDQWHLKEDYKRVNKKKELVDHLRSKILLLACLNLALMPMILFYQLLRSFFFYTELIKREPGTLGVRRWSQYGKLYLRHFNEHDHDLKARLNRAYKPANQYLDGFVSPMTAVLASNVAFFAGSILAVFIVLTVWDEDVINVEHVLTLMTALTATVALMRLFIPDENLVFCPEKTLTNVLAHIHYFPQSWKGEAHSKQVMMQLGQLFPYTFVYLIHEIISPIATPLIMIFYLRPKAPAIIDFFRNFTVSVTGVGDVCSFAQMDVRKHGNPEWQGQQTTKVASNSYTRAEDGKTEMSLVHFTLTNPDWKAPETSENFITALKEQACKDAEALPTVTEEEDASNALYSSLNSLTNVGGVYADLAMSVLCESNQTPHPTPSYPNNQPSSSSMLSSVMPHLPPPSLLNSRLVGGSTTLAPPPNLRQDLRRLGLEYAAADMSLSALYLHEMHRRRLNTSRYEIQRKRSLNEELEEETATATGGGESTPLMQEYRLATSTLS